MASGFSAAITGGGTVYVGSSNSYGNLALLKNQVGTTKIGVSNNDGTANSGAYFSSYYGTTEIGAFGHYWNGGEFINRVKYFSKQEFAEGTTVRVRFEQTSGDITAVTGNFVQGTAAKGVNFTANTPAAGMTSQLLNWYEEGTWTPTLGGSATYTANVGTYVRVGKNVTVHFDMWVNLIGSGNTTTISGLPFVCGTRSAGGSVAYFEALGSNVYSLILRVDAGNSYILVDGQNALANSVAGLTNVFANGSRVAGSVTYSLN